jgi:ribosomal protein L20
MKQQNVQINRKMLSELAIQHPEMFDKLVKGLI